MRLVAEKQGRNIKQGELGKILRWLDGEETPEMVCERFIVPSQPEGSLPKGEYAREDRPGHKLQNNSAKLLASKGYQVEMLKEIPGGNGYGIGPRTSPNFLIEGRVFDCYAPEKDAKMKNINKKIYTKITKQAPNIILNITNYDGDVLELINYLKQRTSTNGDLKRLEELWIIKDNEIIYIGKIEKGEENGL